MAVKLLDFLQPRSNAVLLAVVFYSATQLFSQWRRPSPRSHLAAVGLALNNTSSHPASFTCLGPTDSHGGVNILLSVFGPAKILPANFLLGSLALWFFVLALSLLTVVASLSLVAP
jgi:hypothetical protein